MFLIDLDHSSGLLSDLLGQPGRLQDFSVCAVVQHPPYKYWGDAHSEGKEQTAIRLPFDLLSGMPPLLRDPATRPRAEDDLVAKLFLFAVSQVEGLTWG